ncbi:unnamed protein product [Urochloa decumbens]|uniref:KIB1-4 beta-propeller domain-containing protein n=1 Tax=Urochloa decumbens TaxID=240449 RepID=A0ABC9G1G7_9POAL
MASGARGKRARTGLADPPKTLSPGSSPLHLDWRDWANGLSAGPAGLISELLLSDDVADYVRFRAACAAWRTSTADPRAHGVADRRFHPRRWAMLPRRASSDQSRQRLFLNAVTGELIHVRVPDLRRYHICGTTAAEGLLVVCKKATKAVELLNPLTGQRAGYPRMDTQLVPGQLDFVPGRAGLADDSTLGFLCGSRILVVAKPGDEHWMRLNHYGHEIMAALPFAGRLYCITHRSVLVVETTAAAGGGQPLRLSLVADHELDDTFNQMYPVYVNDGGGLILVSRNASRLGVCGLDKEIFAYGADLDTGSLVQLWGLGGRALFVGAVRSQSVSVDARVSASIRADTVYTCEWDPFTAQRPTVLAFDLWGGEFSRPNFDKKDIAHYLACVE